MRSFPYGQEHFKVPFKKIIGHNTHKQGDTEIARLHHPPSLEANHYTIKMAATDLNLLKKVDKPQANLTRLRHQNVQVFHITISISIIILAIKHTSIIP